MNCVRIMWLGLALGGCTPALSGNLVTAEGEITVSDEGRVNVTSLSPEGSDQPVQTFIVNVDADGSFKLTEDLPPGEYLVEAVVPGYKVASQRVTVGSGEPVEIVMTRVSPARRKAIGINTGGDMDRGTGGATLTPPKL